MPPRKKTSAANRKAAPAAAQKAAAMKSTTAAKRGARATPTPPAATQPTPPAPVPAAPKVTKHEIELEVTLAPVEGNSIRLDFCTGKSAESANLSRKRTSRNAFLTTCWVQGIDDAEVVKCTDVNGKMVADRTSAQISGHHDDTYCNVTFRSAQVSPGMVSAARRQESEEEDVGDEDDEGDDRSGWGWGYTQAL